MADPALRHAHSLDPCTLPPCLNPESRHDPSRDRPVDHGAGFDVAGLQRRSIRLRPGATASTRTSGRSLQKHCLRCHGEEKPKGDVNLAKFADEESLRGDPELWLRVVDALVERTMPPPGNRAGPNVDDRQHAAASIQAILDAVEGVRDPGPSLIQRLTRRQYNNTIRDLLGVDTHPADAFPADGGGGGGFDNNASTLFVPPILMEKYLAAAADVLDEGRPGAVHRGPTRPGPARRTRPPGAASPRSPGGRSAGRSTPTRSTG